MEGMGEYTDEFVFSWTLNKNFIKNDYKMRVGDKVVWRDYGMMGWNKDKKRLVVINFGLDGTIGTGEQIEQKDNETIWEGRIVGPQGSMKYRFRTVRVDNDTMFMQMAEWKDGKFAPYGPKSTYKRKKEK